MKAWAFYDWANSVYSLVITSTIFPIYYAILTTAYEKNEYVTESHKWIKVPVRNTIKLFGNEYHPDAVYGYSLTISFLIVVLLSPILSALADTIGNKKIFPAVLLLSGCYFLYGISIIYQYAHGFF